MIKLGSADYFVEIDSKDTNANCGLINKSASFVSVYDKVASCKTLALQVARCKHVVFGNRRERSTRPFMVSGFDSRGCQNKHP